MNAPRTDRALALSCDRALVGLTPEEELELVSLLPPGAHLDASLERAAAAIALAELGIDEPLPRHLAERVLAAACHGASQPPVSARGGTVPITRPEPAASRTVVLPSRDTASPADVRTNVVPLRLPERRTSVAPWFIAAACLGVAACALLWVGTRDPVGPAPAASNDTPAPTPTPKELRDKLLAEAKDVTRVAWGETGDQAGKGETGEVVWSNARQEGYMVFRAVAKNDPKASQYQLWIFDAERDERYPVDGGVFDVDTSSGEVVIPITARVAVGKPTLFAVTVEKPGGVVVSKRERIVVAAKPS